VLNNEQTYAYRESKQDRYGISWKGTQLAILYISKNSLLSELKQNKPISKKNVLRQFYKPSEESVL